MLLVLALLLQLGGGRRLFGSSPFPLLRLLLGPGLGLFCLSALPLLVIEVAADGGDVGAEDGTERVEEGDEGLLRLRLREVAQGRPCGSKWR